MYKKEQNDAQIVKYIENKAGNRNSCGREWTR